MSSGVTVHPDALSLYGELKMQKKYKYIIFKLSDDVKEIVAEKAVEPKDSVTYETFLEDLPDNEPRYAVYDFDYETANGEGQRNKIIFYSWIPDNSKIKAKMVHAASLDALRRPLVGLGPEIQGTDLSEVAFETVLDKAKRSK